MNFYSASVALLWGTAFRVVAPPTVSRVCASRRLFRKVTMRFRPGRQVADGVPRTARPG